jgi:RNA polymerase sigma-70 factor, ECF subfamily
MDADRVSPLLDAASRGDKSALDQLVAHYLPRLHAFVRVKMGAGLRAREGSADIVQSVCREALEERDNFVFKGEAPFLSWLMTAALNKMRERARFHGRQRRDVDREEDIEDLAEIYGTLLTPSRVAIDREEIDRFESALDRLPDDEREVIVLARIVGLPHKEIAAHIGRTTRATTSLLGYAMVRLAKEMKNSDG